MEPSRLSTSRAKMDQELGTSYIPKPIARTPKLFSPGMLQLISKGERSFTRVDEHMGSSPYLSAVQNMLITLESLAAAMIDGAEIDLLALLMHNIKTLLGTEELYTRVTAANSIRAIQYRDYISAQNSCSDMSGFTFDKQSIFDIHEQLTYPSGSSFRRSYRGEFSDNPDMLHPRLPQRRTLAPELVDEYIDDLCRFCNTDYYTPQIQAGLAHFQLEYIRPFKSHIDALGRQISCIIYAKRCFTRNVIVPVAVESILRIDKPIDNFKANQDSPAKQSPLELWIYHGAQMLIRQSSAILEMEQNFMSIEERWRGLVPKVRRDDICDVLLHDLLAHPIINAKYISDRCDKTLPAANDALKKLVDSKILVPIDNRRRNRYFIATDVLDLYRYRLDDIVPHGWLPGTEMFNA